jgi:hypothetical protein
MRGAIPPFSNTVSWRDAQLKHGDNFKKIKKDDMKETCSIHGINKKRKQKNRLENPRKKTTYQT